MTTKLTLSIDEAVIKKAKKYAKENGRSLSALIESYLIGITSEQEDNSQTTPITSKLLGAFKVDGEIAVSKYFADKYKDKI